jgi:hypothetical protein
MVRALDAAALGLVSAALGAACSGAPVPGTPLGTYKVVGQPLSNSCGLPAPDPWTFDVEVSESGNLFYFSWLDGTPPLSAPMASPSSVVLLATQQAGVDATADGGAGPCTMQRNDTISLSLSAGSPPPAFTGTIAYAFSVVQGATCSDQLQAGGGSYAVLPCTMSFSVSATRQ